jgi:hypothetical protein
MMQKPDNEQTFDPRTTLLACCIRVRRFPKVASSASFDMTVSEGGRAGRHCLKGHGEGQAESNRGKEKSARRISRRNDTTTPTLRPFLTPFLYFFTGI